MKSSFLICAASKLGGDVLGPNSIVCPGPGHSPLDRSLHVSFRSDRDFICHSYAGDDWRDCRDYVAKVVGRRGPQPFGYPISRIVVPLKDDAQRTAKALAIWSAAGPPGRAIQNYLKLRRLELPTGLSDGEVIRFHPSCPFRLENGSRTYLPAMVCLIRDIVTDAPLGIHRTALEADGLGKSKHFKSPSRCRQMLGRASRAAIKLAADSDVAEGIAISEGVENAIAAMCGGLRPVWAVGSSVFLMNFQVLKGIENLTILADHDPAGLQAARSCAKTWTNAGRDVTIAYPPRYGADWNDTRE